MTHNSKIKFRSIALILIVSLSINTILPFQAMAAQATQAAQTEDTNPANQTEDTNPANQTTADDSSIQPDQTPTTDTTTITTESKKTEASIVGELTDKREQNVKRFIKDDLTFEADIYPYAVHYLDNGIWQDIDNTLVYSKDDENNGVLENTKNDFKIKFANNTKNNNLVSIQKGEYNLSWNLEGIQTSNSKKSELDTKAFAALSENDQKKSVTKNTSGVKFSSALPDTDLNYSVNGNIVKEDIVLNVAPKNPVYTFNLNTKKLIPVLQEDKSIIFYDEKDLTKGIFQINAPYMYDAKHAENRDINVTLAETKSGYSLTLQPNKDWLNSPDRQYPVVIDPDVQTSLATSSIHDTWVASGLPTENRDNSVLLGVGYGTISKVTRTYTKFDLPTLSSGDMVINAELALSLISEQPSVRQTNVHKVNSDWNSTTINWNNAPGYNPKIEDYTMVNGEAGKDFYWNVTGIVKDWYTTGNNFGLMIKHQDETVGYDEFFSADTSGDYAGYHPQVSISYVNNTGLESYWTYHSQEVGRAGTGHINDYNGNLVFEHEDLSMSGSRMPVSIQHVYNTNDISSASIGYGNGWRLNLSQTVYERTINGIIYYEYTDGDGTKHYFKKVGAGPSYNDELNLGINLTKNADGTFTIKDKTDNKLTFLSYGLLRYITDNNNNTIQLDYEGPLLKLITDGAGRHTYLNHDAQGQLINIKDPSNRTTTFEYYAGKLTAITDPDGKKSLYSYSTNNCLASARNYDGSNISYLYNNGYVPRVSKILQSNTDGTMAQERSFTYGDNTTKVSEIPPLFDGIIGSGVSIVEANPPDNSEKVSAIRLNAGASVPQIYGSTMNLKPNTNYIVEFDYWADADSSPFNVDLYPDDLPEVHPTASKTLQHYTWNVTSASPNMNSASLRFFYGLAVPNPSNIYIANVKISEQGAVAPTDLTAHGAITAGVSVIDATPPITKELRLNAGYSVPVALMRSLNLSTNTNYTLEFDYRSDANNVPFSVDLNPDDLPEVHPTANTTIQHYKWNFSSASGNMGNCCLRFFNDQKIPNPANIYISNIKLYKTSNGVESVGPIDPTPSGPSAGVAVTNSPYPQGQTPFKTLKLDAGISVPNAFINRLNLKTNTNYSVEFDYWADADDVLFNVDLYPDDLPEVHLDAVKTLQHYKWDFSSASSSMSDASLRFFNALSVPNPANIYISNVKLYEVVTPSKYSIIREGIQEKKTTYLFNDFGQTLNVRNVDDSATYDNYNDTTNKTQATNSSGLQKTILNRLYNGSAEYDRNYTFSANGANGEGSYSTEASYLGSKSLKFTKETASSSQFAYQNVTLEKGKTYTFSAYVKTSDISNNNNGAEGAYLRATYKNSSNVNVSEESTHLTGTNDWSRMVMTFTVPIDSAATAVTVKAGIENETGTVYFDNLQVEEGSVANRYNLIENSDLTGSGQIPNNWSNLGCTTGDTTVNTTDDDHPVSLNSRVFKLTGAPGKDSRIYQSFNITGKIGDTYEIGAWGKGSSVPKGDYSIKLVFATASAQQVETFNFNKDASDWQFISGIAQAKMDYTRVDLYLFYANNANTAYFDGIQLFKDESGGSYQYDAKGNLVSIQALATQNSSFEYDPTTNDLVKATDPKGNNFKYTYTPNHDIATATSSENVVYSFDYDSFGNPISSKVKDKIDSPTLFINSSATYTPSGNYLSTMTDASGNTVTNTWNETKGLLSSVKDAKNTTTNYTYEANTDRLSTVSKTVSGQTVSNIYAYENDRIKTITQNGFNYNFIYDSLGNNTSVSVGTQNLITNTYGSRAGQLLQSTYGNDTPTAHQVVSNTYDSLGRVTASKFNDTTRFTYAYDSNGNLGYKQDLVNADNFRYQYDLANRLTNVTNSTGNSQSYDYDTTNKLNSLTEKIGSSTHMTSYAYDNDNRPATTTINDSENLYPDGGFELGSNIVSSSSGASNAKIVGPIFDTDKNPKTGSRCLWMEGSAADDYAYLSSTTPVEAGKTYKISFYHMEATTGQFTNTSSYMKLSDGTHVALNMTFHNNKTWNNEVKTWTCPAGITSIQLRFGFRTDSHYSWMAVDDAKVSVDDTTITPSTVTQSYDTIGRMTGKDFTFGSTAIFNTDYTYLPGVGGSTTTKVMSITNKKASDASGAETEYTYDANGNIETITSQLGEESTVIKYYYDELNQVIREDNQGQNKTITYTYNVGGNITKKVEYTYTQGTLGTPGATINYTYNTTWKDKLMNYGTKAITYDNIGNPLTYDGWAYSWEEGRQLASMNKTGSSLSFKYNDSGIRTQKTINGVTTNYTLAGDKVTYEETNSNAFKYDYSQNVTWSYHGFDIPVDTGKSYTFSFDAYISTDANNPATGTTFIANGEGGFGSSYYYDNTKKGTWQHFESTKVPTTNTAKMHLYPSTSAIPATSGYIMYKNVQFKEVGTSGNSFGQPLDNSGFTVKGNGIFECIVNNDNISHTYYTYDANGNLLSMNITSTETPSINGEYYYIRNAQGDITGLFDKTGTQVVSYSYDTWGKLLSTTGTLASTVGAKNPYLYRGYRYDSETGLYYLQSRYYNPDWGRFINADNFGGKVGSLLSHNVFAYCGNNPVNISDPSGHFWQFFVAGFFAYIASYIYESSVGMHSFSLIDMVVGAVEDGVESVVGAVAGVGIVSTIERKMVTKGVSNAVVSGANEAVKAPPKALDIAERIVRNNGTPLQGYKGGRLFLNDARIGGQRLPEGVIYKEYDINPFTKGLNRGSERIVLGDDGSVWFTNDHYNTFSKIK